VISKCDKMRMFKPSILTFGYYQSRVSKLEPKYQDVFVKAYMGYSKQLVYTYLSMIMSVFAAIAFFTINFTFSLFLVIMAVFIIMFGVFLIQFYSNNLEHILESLEDREYTPDYTYEEERKTRKRKR